MKRYRFLFVLLVKYLRTFEAKIMGLQEEVGEWHVESRDSRAFLQHSYKRTHFAIIVNVSYITRNWYHILQYDNRCHWSLQGKNLVLIGKKNLQFISLQAKQDISLTRSLLHFRSLFYLFFKQANHENHLVHVHNIHTYTNTKEDYWLTTLSKI